MTVVVDFSSVGTLPRTPLDPEAGPVNARLAGERLGTLAEAAARLHERPDGDDVRHDPTAICDGGVGTWGGGDGLDGDGGCADRERRARPG